MIKASTQYAVNLVGILVAYPGRSPIKLLSPVTLISAVMFVYRDLILDAMPVCAFSPDTMLFLGFFASQGIEQDYVCGPVCICCRGCCSQKRHPPPNLQSLKGMAIVERLLGVTMLSQALTPRRNPHVFRHQGKPLSGSH